MGMYGQAHQTFYCCADSSSAAPQDLHDSQVGLPQESVSSPGSEAPLQDGGPTSLPLEYMLDLERAEEAERNLATGQQLRGHAKTAEDSASLIHILRWDVFQISKCVSACLGQRALQEATESQALEW